MVFSALSAKAKRLTSPSTSSISSVSAVGLHDVGSAEYIFDDADLKPPEADAPDLRELNACLEALAAAFPDVQVEVFREMLSNFEGESRLAVAADALLKNRTSWIKGRWRLANQNQSLQPNPAAQAAGGRAGHHIPLAEAFKSQEYKDAVQKLAWQEFKGLSKSSINAVLAESNYAYLDARRTLVRLSSRSWRFTLSSVILRRKPLVSVEAEKHPLVIWKSSGHGSIIPCIKSTGNAELDRELFLALVLPLKEQSRATQEEQDRSLAIALNTEEAEEMNSILECECCFSDSPFEQLVSCNLEGHLICFRCVQHSIKEAVFGQGWQALINKDTGTMKCPAVESAGCSGHIPSDAMYRAMLNDKKGPDILHKLDQQLAEHSLVSTGLLLIRCPFCNYAEVDDLYVSQGEEPLRFRAKNAPLVLFFLVSGLTSPFLLLLYFTISCLALLLARERPFGRYLHHHIQASVVRYRRRRRGLKFVCQNTTCQRISCLSCSKEWVDIHICHESSLVALRTQVEQAMSMAIKRVCPRCNMAFVKSTGCNKLTCRCGYKMCYVCRKDIGGTGDGPDVGYRHFCEHFRPDGGARPCTACTKCNLWETEDTEKVLEQARAEAERKWTETEKRELSGAEKAYLEAGVSLQRRSRWTLGFPPKGRWPSMAEFCDFMVEALFAA